MPYEVVNIKAVIRPMRGGSQAHMVEGDDGQRYIAKFAGNPQGNRTLVNECIAARLFERFGILTPPIRFLYLPPSVQEASLPHFSIANKRIPVAPGVHFGSRCPVNPNTTAIFDFLPRKLLSQIENREDFAKALVLDKLLGNADVRQAIFLKAPYRGGKVMFRAWMIDHGMIFAGQRWEFLDIPTYGVYRDRAVYALDDTSAACCEAIKIISKLSRDHLDAAVQDIPSSWLAGGDTVRLKELVEQVQFRAARIQTLVHRHLETLLAFEGD